MAAVRIRAGLLFQKIKSCLENSKMQWMLIFLAIIVTALVIVFFTPVDYSVYTDYSYQRFLAILLIISVYIMDKIIRNKHVQDHKFTKHIRTWLSNQKVVKYLEGHKEIQWMLFFIAVIVITRVVLYYTPRSSVVYNDYWHHGHLGVLMILAFFVVNKVARTEYVQKHPWLDHEFYLNYSPLLLIGGIAFIADELFLLLPGNQSYWEFGSMAVAVVSALIAMLLYIKIKKIKFFQ